MEGHAHIGVSSNTNAQALRTQSQTGVARQTPGFSGGPCPWGDGRGGWGAQLHNCCHVVLTTATTCSSPEAAHLLYDHQTHTHTHTHTHGLLGVQGCGVVVSFPPPPPSPSFSCSPLSASPSSSLFQPTTFQLPASSVGGGIRACRDATAQRYTRRWGLGKGGGAEARTSSCPWARQRAPTSSTACSWKHHDTTRCKQSKLSKHELQGRR